MKAKILQEVPIESIRPYHKNTREHSPEQISKIADSIAEFGFIKPIIVDRHRVVIAGHGALEAARLLKRHTVPIYVAKHLSPEQVASYRIADNRLAEDSSWDRELLKVELEDIKRLKYDLRHTGMDADEIAEVLGEVSAEDVAEENEDAAPEPYSIPVSRPGDLWSLGDHRLICGDCLEPKILSRLCQGVRVSFVYNDPPYGVEIVQEGNVSPNRPVVPALVRGKGKVGGDKPFGKVGGIHRGMKAKPMIAANDYAPIEGDDSTDTAVRAYKVVAALRPRPVMIFWGGNYYADALPPSSCWIVWDKNNGESFFADAELAWTNMKTAVRIFQHTWNGLIKGSERGEKRVHPTQKPIALAEWCLEKYGKQGDVILDMFGGSGSTLMACVKLERTCFTVEKVPNYADVIIRRWQKATSGDAFLKAENLTWTEAKKQRRPRR
jgi:16S rRNA G966 N2-methylase RsmD